MIKQYSTLTSIAVAVIRSAQHYGVKIEPLLERVGLEAEAIKNPNARYPDAEINRLIELAAEASGDENFGLVAGRTVAPTSMHALGFSLLASETLLAALQRLVRYFRIVSDATVFEIDKNKNDYTVSLTFLQRMPKERIDLTITILIELCRRLIGPDFGKPDYRLGKLHLKPQQATAIDHLTEWYGSALALHSDSERIELVLPKAKADAILPTGNAELAYQNDKIVADYLARFDSNRLSERVRAIFMERLVTGKFSEEQIAQQLNLSLRSLQRRLREERTSYQQLLDETRLELALQFINRTQLSVAQIAPLLGFSDSSNFNRAFKRWMGLPPSRYRAAGFQ